MSILEKRLAWAEGIEWKVDKVEEITPEQAAKSMQGSIFWNHCYVCGAFIVEHWFLKPTGLRGQTKFNERKKDLLPRFQDVPYLIVGNKCGPALLSGEELLKAESRSRELKRERRYRRNLDKLKPFVEACKRMLSLDQTGGSSYYRNDRERLKETIRKIKVGSFKPYWLKKLNEIRKRHKLPEIPFHFYEWVKQKGGDAGFICKTCERVVEPKYLRRGKRSKWSILV